MASIRRWLLRHLARRFHIGEDILSHLSTFQRLGEQFEIEAPQEMLPVGARTLVRAVRSRAAPQIRPDWVWPYWMEHQLDPTSEAFVPRGHIAVLTNLTARNWTAVGNLWSAWEAVVDPAGLLTPWYDSWSLDWWVEDHDEHADTMRWRFPSRDREVSQALLRRRLPVVETRLGVSGGEVVSRAYAQVFDDLGEMATMELENRSGQLRRVALAVRPYNPEGLAVVSDITVDGTVVTVGDAAAVLLDVPPRGVVLSTFHDGDSAELLRRGFLRGAGRSSVHDPAGLAQAALAFELPPGETLRAAVPLVPGDEQKSPKALMSRWRTTSHPMLSADEVGEAWGTTLERGATVDLPDEDLQAAVDANRAYQLLLHDPGSITPGPLTYHRFWFRDAAYQCVALDRWGLHEEAADVLRSFPERQRADGFFYSQWREWDANGAAIWAVAEHHRLTGDDQLLEELAPSVLRGARWIGRKRRERRRDAPELRGLLPPGVSAEHLGPFDYYYWDNFFALRGLRDGAYVAYQMGDLEAARDAEQTYDALIADVRASIERVAERLGQRVIPAGPKRGIDPGMIGSLAACEPLRVLPPDDDLVQGTLEVIRDRFVIGDAFFQGISHTGLGTYLTLQLAFVELERGDPRAWSRLRWMLDAATPTWTWPEAIHPQLGGGCMGDGHHGWASADFLSFVRQVLVRESWDGSIELLALLPDEWRGRPVEVRDAPTHHGHVSYSLTWDGDQPVLEWSCEKPDVVLSAPGLDPGWSTTESAGRIAFPAVDA